MVADLFICDVYKKQTSPVLCFARGAPEAAFTCELKVIELRIHVHSLIAA